MNILLHQFEFSHFNDKARWALNFKNVEHERRSYLPGPHMPAIKKLAGSSQTPVLQIGDEIVAGSAGIIDRLETAYPDPALYPADPELRAEALELQAEFDKHVGPATRTVLFNELVNEGSYLCAMFARKASRPRQILYRATFPLARGLIAKGNGTTDPENVQRCTALVDSTLDSVYQRVANTGYMVGDCFSVADLTAAALLAPLANPQHPDMARPQPVPESVAKLLANYQNHPTIAWVGEMYERHRS